jgi:hypothetical protein
MAIAATALAGLGPACKKADPGGAPPSGSAAASATSSDLPPPRTERRTTSGEIALGNLNGFKVDRSRLEI